MRLLIAWSPGSSSAVRGHRSRGVGVVICCRRSSPSVRGRARGAQRGGDQLIGALAGGVAQQLVGLGGGVAELAQPLAGERARGGRAAGGDRAGAGLDAEDFGEVAGGADLL